MYFNRRIDEVMAEFGTGPDGLTEAQVAENLEKYGPNKLYEKKKKSVFAVFLSQFKDLLVIILIIAAMISMATGNVESTVVILAVLILNAILGTVQYLKAEKSLDSLKSLSSPTAKVIRNGEHMEIKAEDLAAGDIIRLEAGDIVPGDARVIDSYSLKVNESSLTGESEGVEKFSDPIEGEKVALGDQKNMVFSGSLVTYGRGLAVVTGVGVHTELGKIADLMNNTAERKTPLQVTMDGFSKKLSMAIIIICIGVFGLSVYRDMEITDALLFAVALAVAAIPEALSSIITISLAIGTSRMADQNAIIKQLNAVEGLGCVSVICSDKTGTLTQNKMTVEQLYYDDDLIDPLLQASILCNDTVIADGVTKGDPTETAFVDYYMSKKDDYDQVKAKYPRLSELPFDSDRKLMSTLHDIDGTVTMYTKGALDVILDRVSGLSEERKEEIRQYNFDLSDQGLRVLAFARRIFDEPRDLDFDDEKDFQFLGLIAEMDPPRPESAQAVADCIAAGIKPIMITGDHKITASAIARRIGILQDGDIAVTGTELDDMDDATLREKLPHISVYARVSPDNKIRIVFRCPSNFQVLHLLPQNAGRVTFRSVFSADYRFNKSRYRIFCGITHGFCRIEIASDERAIRQHTLEIIEKRHNGPLRRTPEIVERGERIRLRHPGQVVDAFAQTEHGLSGFERHDADSAVDEHDTAARGDHFCGIAVFDKSHPLLNAKFAGKALYEIAISNKPVVERVVLDQEPCPGHCRSGKRSQHVGNCFLYSDIRRIELNLTVRNKLQREEEIRRLALEEIVKFFFR